MTILILCNGDVKSELNEKESVMETSRDGGCFLRTLNFPQARDCKFLCRSASGMEVELLISCECVLTRAGGRLEVSGIPRRLESRRPRYLRITKE